MLASYLRKNNIYLQLKMLQSGLEIRGTPQAGDWYSLFKLLFETQ